MKLFNREVALELSKFGFRNESKIQKLGLFAEVLFGRTISIGNELVVSRYWHKNKILLRSQFGKVFSIRVVCEIVQFIILSFRDNSKIESLGTRRNFIKSGIIGAPLQFSQLGIVKGRKTQGL